MLPAGFERTLAHRFLGSENPLAKRILYALVGGPRRSDELARLVHGNGPNDLTDAIRLLEGAHVVVGMVDARTKPTATAYRLSTFGLLVVDWMRRYEFLDELATLHDHPSLAAPA